MARKTPQEVAKDNLAIAERVNEKAQARIETTKAAYEKAVADAKHAERRVRAARMLALDEEMDTIDAEPTSADESDVL